MVGGGGRRGTGHPFDLLFFFFFLFLHLFFFLHFFFFFFFFFLHFFFLLVSSEPSHVHWLHVFNLWSLPFVFKWLNVTHNVLTYILELPIVKEQGSVNLTPFPASCLYESQARLALFETDLGPLAIMVIRVKLFIHEPCQTETAATYKSSMMSNKQWGDSILEKLDIFM